MQEPSVRNSASDEDKVEVKELKEKIAEKALSPQAKAVVDKELSRLERISPSSPEYSRARNYIDWILDLPWLESTKDTLDLYKAEEDLNHDHYGLKVKKRILEFLAVRKLGGLSTARSSALSALPVWARPRWGSPSPAPMNRKFVRIALGGVRDEQSSVAIAAPISAPARPHHREPQTGRFQ